MEKVDPHVLSLPGLELAGSLTLGCNEEKHSDESDPAQLTVTKLVSLALESPARGIKPLPSSFTRITFLAILAKLFNLNKIIPS